MTTLTLHWVRLHPGKKWHGWPHGGNSTLCGTVTPLQLGGNTVEMTTDPPVPTGSNVCEVCRRTARLDSAPATMSPATSAWYRLLTKHATRMRVAYPVKELGQLAERLAEIGSPDSPEAREVYESIQRLLLTPLALRAAGGQRVPTLALKNVLAVLPPNVAAVRRVAMAVRVWGRVTGLDAAKEKMNRSRVVETMQQVPALEPYIQHLHRKGWSSLAQMFHPNTLAAAKKDPALRGLFGGAGEYWDATADTLEVVT